MSEIGALRYTPGGAAAVEFRIRHESQQTEAGLERKVSADVAAIAFEAQARLIAGAGLEKPVRVKGFLSARSKRSKRLVLHVTHIEFLQGE